MPTRKVSLWLDHLRRTPWDQWPDDLKRYLLRFGFIKKPEINVDFSAGLQAVRNWLLDLPDQVVTKLFR